ncbi:MAG: DegT/DnrJ/EryC1/StrS family aminotransferase [Rhizobiaceae bacterium]|nr:DegT/DnrJ/EryC1/StrS family aminotransferase [Rhizobiaceae bacterium]
MKVPFFDWAGLYAEKADEFTRIFHETASRGGFILQRDVEEFEENLARYVGAKYAVGVSDGTNAILLGLRASGIQPGDEIIIAGHSFIAAAQSIHFGGATPVPVELDEHDWLIAPDAIEAAITPRTRAIMPVHVNGRVCRMDAILDIAKRHGLEVFEDSAQAMGAKFDGQGAGTIGRWGTYSFYPSKTLGCFGDAGGFVTNDPDIYERVRAMRNHGANKEKSIPLDVDIWGTNCRMDNLHAAILNFKLGYYDQAIARRREIAQRYHDALKDVEDARLPPAPDADNRYFDIYQNYEFCHPERDALRKHLADGNIGTIIQWGGFGIHQLKGLGMQRDLPKTDRFFRESLLLPLNHILSDEQVDHVVASLHAFFGGR